MPYSVLDTALKTRIIDLNNAQSLVERLTQTKKLLRTLLRFMDPNHTHHSTIQTALENVRNALDALIDAQTPQTPSDTKE